MQRSAHYLKTVAGGTMPRSILSLAAVRGQDGTVYHHLCHTDTVCEGDAYLDGISGTLNVSLWQVLAEQVKNGYPTQLFMMYAVEQLALLGFWDELEEGRWELSDHDAQADTPDGKATERPWNGVCILQDPPTIVACRPAGCKKTLKILDCRNYGVSDWQSLFVGYLPAVVGRDTAACQADAINVFVRQLVSLVNAAKLGSLKTTAASQAMHAYRHRFMREIILVHNRFEGLEIERAAMYAGRCEAWTVQRPVANLYHLDFNSHYPSVVIGSSIPARLAGYVNGCVPNPRQLANDGFVPVAEVTIDTPEPIFPLRYSEKLHGQAVYRMAPHDIKARLRDRDVFYPTGRFTTVLCWPELQVAYARDYVRLIHRTAWYEPADLFSQWSTELATIEDWTRQHGVKGLREFVKRLRNCLFGKFGQWSWTWTPAPWEAARQPFGSWYGVDPETGTTARYRSVGWTVQIERNLGESFESCPVIAAHVYSLARVKLWQAVECAGQDNVHYMDSDSLWVNHSGFTALDAAGWLSQSEPGKLKIEGMHTTVTFHGLKQYTHEGKSVNAGVPKGTPGSYRDGWRYQGPERTMPALLAGHRPCEGEITNVVRPSGGYRHGVVTVGGRVMPHHLRIV